MAYNVSEKEAKKLGIARVKVGSDSKKSSGSSSKVKVDNSAVEGYDKAVGTYQNMLPSLKPRYDELVASIDAQKAASLAADAQLAGTEDTNLKKTLASRGLEVNTGNEFFRTEDTKLQGNQNTRATGIATTFETQKAGTRLAQTQDENDIQSAIAGLLVGKGEAKYKAGRDAKGDAQWEQTFKFTQDEAAADRAIELRRVALAEREAGGSGSSKSTAFNNDIATMVGTAYAGGFGNGEGIRETIAKQLSAKHPDKKAEVSKAIDEYFPNGWEGQIYKKDGGDDKSALNVEVSKLEQAGKSTKDIKNYIRANGFNPADFGFK